MDLVKGQLLPRRAGGSTFKAHTYLQPCKQGEEPCNYYDNKSLLPTRKYEGLETSKFQLLNMTGSL